MTEVDFVIREDDAAAWFDSGRVVINVRWVNSEDEIVAYIVEGFIHEYVEHVLGLGHEAACYIEKITKAWGK